MSDHVGLGPDGGNLLGFLAAVGTFVTLSEAWPDREVRMSWTVDGGWRPVWHLAGPSTEAQVVHALHRALQQPRWARAWALLGPDLPVSRETFRTFAQEAATAARPDNRQWTGVVVALGCEATGTDERIEDTAFRTMSGAGHQHFLGFFEKLAEITTADNIRSALFLPWAYEDEGPTLRWDPVDDRRHAYRADDPATSKDHPIRTVRGANRLAMESLICFPTVPLGGALQTTGFQRLEQDWVVQWPIWTPRLSLATLQSLLTHPALAEPRAPELQGLGVVEVFRARRLTEGRFRTFTPAEGRLGSLHR
jgi:hypothetical protein